jgi:hypothetical protein
LLTKSATDVSAADNRVRLFSVVLAAVKRGCLRPICCALSQGLYFAIHLTVMACSVCPAAMVFCAQPDGAQNVVTLQ